VLCWSVSYFIDEQRLLASSRASDLLLLLYWHQLNRHFAVAGCTACAAAPVDLEQVYPSLLLLHFNFQTLLHFESLLCCLPAECTSCSAAPVDLEQVHPSLLLPPHDPAPLYTQPLT
jgi:hypothetical protein